MAFRASCRTTAVAAVILLALAATPSVVQGAIPDFCKPTFNATLDACSGILAGVAHGAPASELEPSDACCKAATAVLSDKFMDACACSLPAVSTKISQLPAGALDTLVTLITAKCPAASLVSFPTCSLQLGAAACCPTCTRSNGRCRNSCQRRCDANCNCGRRGGGGGGGNCFPGAATVTVPGGAAKPMSDLAVGDKVLAVQADGALSFQAVYFFDHQLAAPEATYMRLALAGGRTLELSGGHLLPVGSSMTDAVMTRARDVQPGMPLLAVTSDGATLEPELVTEVSKVVRAGLFAPLVDSGVVVVDGVAASVHSDWILDPILDAMGKPHLVHDVMQAVHAPARVLYKAVGARVMSVVSPMVSGVLSLDARQVAAAIGVASK